MQIERLEEKITAALNDARAVAGQAAEGTDTQSGELNFLEAEPYYDQSAVPVNTYKNKVNQAHGPCTRSLFRSHTAPPELH